MLVEISYPEQSGGDLGRELTKHVRVELARELHDRVAQALTTMLVEMENFKRDQYGRLSVIQELDLYQDATRDVLNNVRSLLFELRDEDEVSVDFVGHLRTLTRQFESRSGIRASLHVSRRWPSRLAAHAATQLQRIVGEALNNVRMHSGANRVSIRLRTDDGQRAVIEIRDDGRGLRTGLEVPGFGLVGMKERAVLLGGEVKILRGGRCGTLLVATFPVSKLT